MIRNLVLLTLILLPSLSLGQKGSSDSSKVKYYLLQGQRYYAQDIQVAQEYCDSAMALASILNDSKSLATATNMRGIFSLVQGKFEEALYDLSRTAKYNLNIENYLDAAGSIGNMGSVYKDMGDYPKALEHYTFAGRIFADNEALMDQSINLNSIGEIHFLLENYQKANDYYQQALEINMNLGDQGYGLSGINLVNIGLVYFKQGESKKALEKYEKALTIFERLGDIRGISECKSNMASAYMDIGDNQLANKILREALVVFQNLNDQFRLSDLSNRLGDTEFAIGNYEKAHFFYQDALSNARKINANNLQLDAFEDLEKLHFTTGKFELAYRYGDSVKVMNDSIFNETKSEQIAEIDGKYQYDLQQQKILEEKQQRLHSETKAETRLLWLVLSIVLLIAVILVTALYIRNRKAKEKARISALKHQALRAQMNPHFTFNILNGIQNLILLNKSEEASEYLSEFAIFLRNTLEYSNQTTISLKQELNFIEVYLELEKVRFKDNLVYHFDLTDTVDYDQIEVPSLFIQPFVENAIVHGFNGSHKGTVTLSIRQKNSKTIEINVVDNGQGLSEPKEKKVNKESLGIKISLERLKRMDERNTITIENRKDESSGVRVQILIHQN